MTTKVQVRIVQEHNPVVVSLYSPENNLTSQYRTLTSSDEVFEAYVHSAQSVRIREMTPSEISKYKKDTE